MFKLFNRKTHLSGLDIGTSSLKLVELSLHDKQYCLENYATIPLPTGTIVDKDVKDVAALTQAVTELVNGLKLGTQNVALAMPRSLVITKIISMDAGLNDEDMESQVELMANRYIDYPIDEVSLDFDVLGINSSDKNKIDVLIAAARTDHVDLRIDSVEDAGLVVKVIDVESYAIERALPLLAHSLPDGGIGHVIAVVNIGYVVTSLTVIDNMTIAYTREEAFGGKEIIQRLAEKQASEEEKSSEERRDDSDLEEYRDEVMASFCEAAALQVSNALKFYDTAGKDKKISHIVLTGGSVSVPNIMEVIYQKVGIDITIARPFKGMTISPKINKELLAIDEPSLLVACGLALRSFDT